MSVEILAALALARCCLMRKIAALIWADCCLARLSVAAKLLAADSISTAPLRVSTSEPMRDRGGALEGDELARPGRARGGR